MVLNPIGGSIVTPGGGNQSTSCEVETPKTLALRVWLVPAVASIGEVPTMSTATFGTRRIVVSQSVGRLWLQACTVMSTVPLSELLVGAVYTPVAGVNVPTPVGVSVQLTAWGRVSGVML